MTNILTICNYKIYFIISFFFLSIFDTSHSQFHCIVLLVVGEYITNMTILTYIIMEPPVLAWCRSASTNNNSCIPCKCAVDIYLSLHISILLTQENSTPWRGAVFRILPYVLRTLRLLFRILLQSTRYTGIFAGHQCHAGTDPCTCYISIPVGTDPHLRYTNIPARTDPCKRYTSIPVGTDPRTHYTSIPARTMLATIPASVESSAPFKVYLVFVTLAARK